MVFFEIMASRDPAAGERKPSGLDLINRLDLLRPDAITYNRFILEASGLVVPIYTMSGEEVPRPLLNDSLGVETAWFGVNLRMVSRTMRITPLGKRVYNLRTLDITAKFTDEQGAATQIGEPVYLDEKFRSSNRQFDALKVTAGSNIGFCLLRGILTGAEGATSTEELVSGSTRQPGRFDHCLPYDFASYLYSQLEGMPSLISCVYAEEPAD